MSEPRGFRADGGERFGNVPQAPACGVCEHFECNVVCDNPLDDAGFCNAPSLTGRQRSGRFGVQGADVCDEFEQVPAVGGPLR